MLRRAADIIRDRNQELSEIETHDTGKPIQETIVADAVSGADALEYFGGLAASLTGEHIPLAGGDFAYTVRRALGVCVGIGAWNYPAQIACWKAAPALTCGNSMVFKPSETTPLSALRIAEILTEAGAPSGVFNVIQGAGDVGSALISDQRVAKVSLYRFGSYRSKSIFRRRLRHEACYLGARRQVALDHLWTTRMLRTPFRGRFWEISILRVKFAPMEHGCSSRKE